MISYCFCVKIKVKLFRLDVEVGVFMNNMNLKRLDKILKKTVDNILASKEEICDIAENARKESANLEKEYKAIKEELATIFNNIQLYENNLKKSKAKLMNINKNYDKYSEESMKEIYLTTDKLRVDLAVEKEREQMVLKMRNDLEIRLKASKETVEKAENLVNHVGIAMDFLNGNLSFLSSQLEDINNKHLLAIKVLESQEQDRKKIAREIHDGIAQTMSNVVIKAEVCNKLATLDIDKTKEELKNLKELTRQSLQDVRRIIYDLRPMSLDDLGIVPTLERYIEKIKEETDLEITFNVKGNVKKLENFINVALFRVAQETLNNTIKHAEAKKVQINLIFSDKYIELFIKDDGKGFKYEKIRKNLSIDSGYGISGMEERVKLLGGDFTIKSEIDKGTFCRTRIEITQ